MGKLASLAELAGVRFVGLFLFLYLLGLLLLFEVGRDLLGGFGAKRL